MIENTVWVRSVPNAASSRLFFAVVVVVVSLFAAQVLEERSRRQNNMRESCHGWIVDGWIEREKGGCTFDQHFFS